MIGLTILESGFLLLLSVLDLMWCICNFGDTKIDTILGATVFGFVLMSAGLAHLRSIAMFL